jgi:ERI1 exoribonuclease 3
VNPQLTVFCVQLTGITQNMITDQPVLADVLKTFHKWLETEKLLETRFIFVTCGDWDLKTILPSQCDYFQLKRENYFEHWINIKKSFYTITGKYAKYGMMGMLNELNIQHVGRHHSGIDDCKNIAEILKALVRRGNVLKENGIKSKRN